MCVAIRFQDVKKVYGEKVILEHVNLTIDKGEFVTIVGMSGCGKTTFLKMVNGLIEPTEGEIWINDENLRGLDLIQLRRKIGYAIQGSVLFPHMTIEKNIAYVPSLRNKRDKKLAEEAVEKWMKIVGLDASMRHCYPCQLSGGQQQRAGIARALAASPDLLLMDEPFGAVDEITRASLQDEIIRIHRETGITILFVTHDIKEALKLGTKVLVMDQGEILQYDSPAAVKLRPANAFVKSLLRRVCEEDER